MHTRGFTLIELLVTLVIASILAAIAIPRWQGETGIEARQFRDETVAALRLAQKSAIATHRTVCANFAASQVGFSISAHFADANCSGGTALIGPSGTALKVIASKGVSYSGQPASLIFDAAGRPNVAVTFSVGDLASQPIRVEAETGYVH